MVKLTSLKQDISGYLSPRYADSLKEFGQPLHLSLCGGWLLERAIPGFDARDAMGCYPLFSCMDWSRLESDIEVLENRLLSVSLLPDPFGDYDPESLRRIFKDVMVPFKEHFVADLSQSRDNFVTRHHRYYARRALRQVAVEFCEAPGKFLGDWLKLYKILIARHGITGIQAFSTNAFAIQLEIPGIVMFRAVHENETVGIHLWCIHDEVATSHLAAYSSKGYEFMASYALYWEAIRYFADRVRWVNLGGGAGTRSDASDGLTSFKRGWATGSRQAYFCGRILNEQRYKEIVESKGLLGVDYFPAYRAGEFE